jgi:two-component system response regulator (stage 0 sporulation protein F)
LAQLKKILVVDDEVGIRELLFDVLSSSGFKVTLAKDGIDSLEVMQKRNFDLLITDVHMPRLDGIGLLKRMKKAGRGERVIVMSGSLTQRSWGSEDTQPVYTQLSKPFPLDSFLNVVSSALAQPKATGQGSIRAN